MSSREDATKVADDLLKKYGMKWAVLVAMRVDMVRKGIALPDEVDDAIESAGIKIRSGCFSTCEVGCSLSKLEAQLMSSGYSLGEDYFRQWFQLLGRAMNGEIDPRDIDEIPALQPVAQDCKFLGCRCSEGKESVVEAQELIPPSSC